MRFAAIVLLMTSSVSGFTFTSTQGRTLSTSALNAGAVVYYSTSTGNTETAAEYIRSAVDCTMEDIGDASVNFTASFQPKVALCTVLLSKAEIDGKFCGLMLDEDNQYDLSEERAKAWVAQLKEEGFF